MTHPGAEQFDGTFEALSQRCLTLGVPLWRYDGTGIASASPLVPDPLRQWLSSDSFRNKLDACVRMCMVTKRMDPRRCFQGRCLSRWKSEKAALDMG